MRLVRLEVPDGMFYDHCCTEPCQTQTMLMRCEDCSEGYCYDCMADWRRHSVEYNDFVEGEFAESIAFTCIYCFILILLGTDDGPHR